MKRLFTTILFLCAVVGGRTAQGATFGNTTGTTPGRNIENSIYMTRFNLSEGGVADSITARILCSFSAKNVKYLIYRVENGTPAGTDSVRLVGWTEQKNVPSGTDGWYGIAFNPKLRLEAGDYYIGAWGSSGAGVFNLYYNSGGGEPGAYRSMGLYDSTATYDLSAFGWTGQTDAHAIYCTYNTTDKIFGDTLSGVSTLSIEGAIIGGQFTSPAKSIVVDSLAWWLDLGSHSTTSSTRRVRAAIYGTADSALIDTTAELTLETAGNGDGMRVFRFVSKPVLAASTGLIPVAWSDTSYGAINVRAQTSSGSGAWSRTYSYATNNGIFPDPLGASKASNYKTYVMLYYHEAGGLKPRRRRIILEGLGLVREATETFAGAGDEIPK